MLDSWLVLGVPMILFVIIDSIKGVKAAIIGAVVACLFELGYSYFIIGEIDSLTIISVGLIICLSLVSFIKENSVYFKMQPAILAGGISIFFLCCWILDKHFLYEMMVKYQKLIPVDKREFLVSDYARELFFKVTKTCTVTFALHTVAMVYIARKCSNIIWVIARALGTILSVAAGFIIAQVFL